MGNPLLDHLTKGLGEVAVKFAQGCEEAARGRPRVLLDFLPSSVYTNDNRRSDGR